MAYTPTDEFALDTDKRMERKFEREPLGIAKNPKDANVLWRIYYADVTKPNGYYTASNLEYPDPTDVPTDSVICIIQGEAEIVRGEFYSFNEDGKWESGDSGAVNGYWTDYETYECIVRIALFDTDFFEHVYPSVVSGEFELNAEGKVEVSFKEVTSGFAPNPRNAAVFWRIYYADGTTVSNVDYPDPADAPSEDVVCILQYMNDQEVDVIYSIDYEDEPDTTDGYTCSKKSVSKSAIRTMHSYVS